MAKSKTVYFCTNCENQTPKWQGRCEKCGEWNTLKETEVLQTSRGVARSTAGASKPQTLQSITAFTTARVSTGIGEVDMVLGGGLVPGSVILLGGDPGIGKSTLALQLASTLQEVTQSVLYISGEESGQQIKMRAERLKGNETLALLTETNLETIIASLQVQKPAVAVIDSIQTVQSSESGGVVGGVSQLSYVTNELVRIAKKQHTTIILIGHVTKEGVLAGPKTVEHMVDVVLYLEGERFGSLRLLRSTKNRFGAVGEVGLLEMVTTGLIGVPDASKRFLTERRSGVSGSVITPVLEGNRVICLEIQALVTTTQYSQPRRTASGYDYNRLQVLVAIIQKQLNLPLHNQDVFVNVAGGFTVQERAADLPVAMAIVSSYAGIPVPEAAAVIGEIGLLGELRSVPHTKERIKECAKLGITQLFVSGGQLFNHGEKSKSNRNAFKKRITLSGSETVLCPQDTLLATATDLGLLQKKSLNRKQK